MGYELIAAVDLGSNSFRLQVGRVLDGQIYPLDAIKEPVRLASGLTPEKHLDKASQVRAIAALARFGERLRGFAPEAVRAVATNAMRVAKNALDFLPEAERALGFPIEIIAGREEARLIYLGAVHSLPAAQHKRLVVDIGGGSTEFIIGKRVEPQLMESLFMGCVSYTLRFFPDGKVDKKRLREAQMAAAKEQACLNGQPAPAVDVSRAGIAANELLGAYFALDGRSNERAVYRVFSRDGEATWTDASGAVAVTQLGERLDTPAPTLSLYHFVVGGDAMTARGVWSASGSAGMDAWYAIDFIASPNFWSGYTWRVWRMTVFPADRQPEAPGAYCHYDPDQAWRID